MNTELTTSTTSHKNDATIVPTPTTATATSSSIKPLVTYASTVAASATQKPNTTTTSAVTTADVKKEADVASAEKVVAVATASKDAPPASTTKTTPATTPTTTAAAVSGSDGATDAAMRNRRRAVIGVRFKTKHCHSFQESGECRYGDSCVFAHGEEELAKYVAIADAAERAAPTHRQPAKFTIPLPASVDRFLHTDNTWWKTFYNQSNMPAFNPPTTTDGEERKSRDYGFGVSAEQERVRALEGNRRVPQAELERHRLQRKAEAIARVNKLTAEGYCGMMAELHNSLGGASSYCDYNGFSNSIEGGEEEATTAESGADSSSASAAGSPSCYYGPYIAPGLYFHPNNSELSSEGITENSSRTSVSDVHQSCALPHESSVSSVSGGGLTTTSSTDSPLHNSSPNKSHPTTPLRPAVFTHNPYLLA